jgi:thiol:disulfide interchange protein DsbA
MFKKLTFALISGLLLASPVMAQQAYTEGVDYQRIGTPVKTSDPDKVVVTEIFWYGCPHCYRFEPFVEKWAKSLPKGVVFEQVPSSLNPGWIEHARAFYAMKMMGAQEQLHGKFFEAIHKKRQRLTGIDAMAKFVGEQGFDEKLFRQHYHSFPVDSQVRKSGKIEQRYGHQGVPAVIVNGKYLTNGSMAKNYDNLLKIIDFLVADELRQ